MTERKVQGKIRQKNEAGGYSVNEAMVTIEIVKSEHKACCVIASPYKCTRSEENKCRANDSN